MNDREFDKIFDGFHYCNFLYDSEITLINVVLSINNARVRNRYVEK